MILVRLSNYLPNVVCELHYHQIHFQNKYHFCGMFGLWLMDKFVSMKKHCLIVCLMLLMMSCADAQKKGGANDIRIENEMPDGWERSEAATIVVIDASGAEVKKVKATVKLKKELSVDIRSLAPGAYTLKVTVNNTTCYDNQFKADFKKEQINDNVVLKFTAPERHQYERPMPAKKPVIYLYPEQTQDVAVQVHFKGALTKTIPAYNEGWKVSASPDGLITNYADGRQYPYLFWEGDTYKQDWNMKEGFVVSAGDSRPFLERVLPEMGSSAKEYNEFVDFWVPVLQKNEYNLVHFAGREYEDLATLEVSPKPDAVLRVFMVFRATGKDTRVVAQHFDGFVRKGFTVVEWGGMQLDAPGTAGR